MNKKLFSFLICLLFSFAAFAQSADPAVKLNDLYIPNAPGLILADQSPASVDKPSTPRAFAVSMLNLAQGGAMEVTPFWLTNKPTYTYEDWVNKTFTLVETFNLSIATYKTGNDFNFSPGFRSQVLRIYSPKSKKQLYDIKDSIIIALSSVDENGNVVIDTAAISRYKAELDAMRNRGLFSFEVAGAMQGFSADNSFKNLQAVKSGVWANIRWSPINVPLNFIGLARYSWANASAINGEDSSLLDFGFNFNYEQPKLDMSIEYVNRTDLAAKTQYHRLALVGNYVLNENVILVASLGKNFSDVNDIITLFGVKFGLSRTKEKM